MQDKHDFELSTLPSLVPVLSTVVGDTMLLLVKHADLIINKVKLSNYASCVVMLRFRAPLVGLVFYFIVLYALVCFPCFLMKIWFFINKKKKKWCKVEGIWVVTRVSSGFSNSLRILYSLSSLFLNQYKTLTVC